jgi:hypothetical protein
MRNTFAACLLAGAVLLVQTPVLPAQATSYRGGFAANRTDIGPVVGLGNLGAANISFGGRFEKGIQTLPTLGYGVLAIELSADYYHYSQDYPLLGNYSFSYIPIGATANYHFNVNNRKLDPFAGLGLGYSIVSTSYAGDYNSGLYFIGRLGVRYFLNDNMALYADAGAGAATLNVGVTFGMGGH